MSAQPTITIPGATVAVAEVYGRCPVQATGTIVVGSIEFDWYFRARSQSWSISVGNATDPDGFVPQALAVFYRHGQPNDKRPYAAGHMSTDEALRHIADALRAFVQTESEFQAQRNEAR